VELVTVAGVAPLLEVAAELLGASAFVGGVSVAAEGV
jgi:hypothetical protein